MSGSHQPRPPHTLLQVVKVLIEERSNLSLFEEELKRAKAANGPDFSTTKKISYEQVRESKIAEELLASAQQAVSDQKAIINSINEEIAGYLSDAVINKISKGSAYVFLEESRDSYFALFKIDQNYHALTADSVVAFESNILAKRQASGPDFSLAGPFTR